MPDVSPACTRLQYSASKCAGCSRNACDRRRARLDLVLDVHHQPREARRCCGRGATMSNDCSSGTPAFSIVASWRVKNVMSFSVTLRPPRNVWRLILVTRMPWRRRLVVTTVSDAAARLAAHLAVVAVDAFPDERVFLDVVVGAGSDCGGHGCPSMRGSARHSLVTASISSRDVMPFLTFSRPDWRRLRTPSFCACCGDVDRVAVAHDELAHVVGDRHHFVDAHAALVARALAVVAADRPVRLPACRRGLPRVNPARSSASGGMSSGFLHCVHKLAARGAAR